MEMFPNLRRFSKRSLLCLYFVCAMFVACAFYTFYIESYSLRPVSSIQNSYPAYSADSVGEKSLEKEQNTILFDHVTRSKVILPVISWTRNSSNLTKNSILQPTFNTISRTPSAKISKVNTQYIYLTKTFFSGASTSTKASVNLPKRTSSALPDTCQTHNMKDSKLILLWTPFFEEWNYFTQERLDSCRNCRNCLVTNDRTMLEESDAVIFHARDMSLTDLPSIRYPHHRWIFFCLESPPYSEFPGMEFMVNMFNWTMTYRRDSDIVNQYGSFVKIHPSRKLDLQSLQWVFNNKTKSVVWMSSHCPTHGGRDDYVEELRKYIDVDVYGKCGALVCPLDSTNECLRNFSAKYKFFLAFENTICKDYVTEKFFRTLEYNMIPVVYGGASYSKIAPTSSYIDALSFKSPKHLAFFLAGIGKDFKMWSRYFRWREEYSVDTKSSQRECDVCSLLHRKNSKRSIYVDFKKWWVSDANCRTWQKNR